jgi:lipoyl(octanoyl) transferase
VNRASGSLKRPVGCYYVDIPVMEYRDAWMLQVRLVRARQDGSLDRDIILSLQHPPVYTLGRRGGRDNLKVPDAFLEGRGIQVVQVERGGDITYHGPEQLVVYPIVDLRSARFRVVDFVEALEEIMIRTLGDFGIEASRSPLNRGVWMGAEKIGSVGIAVRHSVSFHGIALNVNTASEAFECINPCGLKGVSMTSMEKLLGDTVPMGRVRRFVRGHVEEILGCPSESIDIEAVHGLLDRGSEKRTREETP